MPASVPLLAKHAGVKASTKRVGGLGDNGGIRKQQAVLAQAKQTNKKKKEKKKIATAQKGL